MIRIIDNVAYRSKSTDSYRLKAHDLGNGHVEVVGSRMTTWEELDWSPSVVADHLEMMAAYRLEHEEEIKARHAEQSARRAKKRVRRLCKAMGANTLLTLTYRINEGDIARCKADLKEFNRRVLRVIPSFRFVAAFERQKRGAWHVHMAVERVPKELPAKNGVKVKSYNVLRSIWRSVTKDRGGNVDVQAAKRNSQRSPARIASYISGYIVKAFEDGEAELNRWTKYGDFDLPPSVDLGVFTSTADLMRSAFSLLFDSHTVDVFRFDRWKDWFVLYAEDSSYLRPS